MAGEVELMKKHVLICGERGVGKTTLVNKLMNEMKVPVFGFMTKAAPADEKGVKPVYMYPAAGPYVRRDKDNMIGEAGGLVRKVYPEVFENLGMKLLESKEGSIAVMDEIGFMEACSETFCRRILRLLESDTPVLATVKARTDIEFLNEVRGCEKADLFYIDEKNRDDLFEKIMPYIREWNRTI